MAIQPIDKPFSLVGYRFVRGVYNEEVAAKLETAEKQDEPLLDFVVAPAPHPVVTTYEFEGRKVIELIMTVAIVTRGSIPPDSAESDERIFSDNTIIAVKYAAGYIAKDEVDDGKLEKFIPMMPLALDLLFQATRAKIFNLAANASFDVSLIPLELSIDVIKGVIADNT